MRSFCGILVPLSSPCMLPLPSIKASPSFAVLAVSFAFVLGVACSDSLTAPVDGSVGSVLATPDSSLIPALGFKRMLEAVAYAEDGAELSPGILVWGSRDPTVAVVDDAGRVVGRGYGETLIIVSAGQRRDTVVVRVEQVPAQIDLTEPVDTLRAIGDWVRLFAAAVDSAGHGIELPEAQLWSSSDSSVMVVNRFGLVEAMGPGTAFAIWSDPGVADSVPVVVEQKPDFLWVHGGVDELAPGDTTTILASLRDRENHEIQGAEMEWGTSDPEVAVVSSTGTVTAVGGGNVVITGRSRGLQGWRSVSVTPDVPPRGTMVASAVGTYADAFGQDFVLEAHVDDGAGATTAVPAAWSSRDEEVATVSGSVATSRGNGVTWLVAEYDGRVDSVAIEVERVPVAIDFQGVPQRVSLTLSDGLTVYPGTLDRLGHFEHVAVEWTIRDTTVATVVSSGLGGRGKGETWAVAAALGLRDSIHVTVEPYHSGEYRIATVQDLEAFRELGIEGLGGTLWIYGTLLPHVDGLESLRSVGGDLWVKFNDELVDLSGLANLQVVSGDIIIEKNAQLADPDLPGLVQAGRLAVFDNLGFGGAPVFPSLESVEGRLYLSDTGPRLSFPSLRWAGAVQVAFRGPEELSFPRLEAVYGQFDLIDVPETRIVSAPALWRADDMTIRGNAQLETLALDGLTTLQRDVTIETNPRLTGLDRLALTSGVRDLRIRTNESLTTVSGLRGLGDALGSDPIVTGDLWIENNPSLPSAEISDLLDFIQDKFPGIAFLGRRATGGNG